MSQFRTIEIDFDIHKMIEAERRNFDEPPYVALRRLLRLAPIQKVLTPTVSETGSETSWKEDGVELPHGSLVRMEYNRGKQIYDGTISNGKWIVDGRVFDSPSGAASELAVTKKGKSTKLNGWLYWKVKLPGATEWKSLRLLRARAQALKRGS